MSPGAGDRGGVPRGGGGRTGGGGRARLLGLIRAAPRPLAALLATVAVFGLSWALLVPPWQSPDTPTHYAYAESLAARRALPGDRHRPAFSTSEAAADGAVGASRIAFALPEARPSWDPAADRAYRQLAGRLSRSDGGGPDAAAVNPPLYYAYADVGYLVAIGGDTFDRLYTMQISGVLLLLITVVGAWLLIGEVLGPQRVPQLAGAAVAGLEPMNTFISTSITPDALLIPLWTLGLWLGARVIARGCERRVAVSLCAITATAILTKATSYALVPAVLLALGLGWRRRPAQQRAERRTIVVALAALAGPVLAWVLASTALGRSAINTVRAAPGAHPTGFSPRQFLSYVWQFYLPRLPFMAPFRTTADVPLYDLWIGQGWSTFGWLDVPIASWIYPVLAGVTAVVAGGGVAVLTRVRRSRRALQLTAFFALAAVALLAGLHATEYRSIIAGDGPVIQGRYLLPLIGLFGLTVAAIVARLPARARGPLCGSIVGALLILQLLALATVARAYYT